MRIDVALTAPFESTATLAPPAPTSAAVADTPASAAWPSGSATTTGASERKPLSSVLNLYWPLADESVVASTLPVTPSSSCTSTPASGSSPTVCRPSAFESIHKKLPMSEPTSGGSWKPKSSVRLREPHAAVLRSITLALRRLSSCATPSESSVSATPAALATVDRNELPIQKPLVTVSGAWSHSTASR
jgi:hypothetical protein